jgi:uncharacterized membrane protein SpoIIM required for sporulation
VVTTALAVPVLLLTSFIEVHVTPHILRSLAGV